MDGHWGTDTLSGSTISGRRIERGIRRIVVHLVNLVSDLLADDPVGRYLRRQLLRGYGADIGRGSTFHGGTWFSDPRRLSVGRGSFVNRGCYFDLEGGVGIGDGVTIGNGVRVITTHHEIGPPGRRCGPFIGRGVEIGSGTWLGSYSTILAGVRVGAGVVVAAGSVVTADVPDNVVVAGVPARIVEGHSLPGA